MTVQSAVNHLSKHGAVSYAAGRFSVSIGTTQIIVSADVPTEPSCPIGTIRVVPQGSVAGVNMDHLTRAIKFAERGLRQ